MTGFASTLALAVASAAVLLGGCERKSDGPQVERGPGVVGERELQPVAGRDALILADDGERYALHDPATVRVIEQRLHAVGMMPGAIDGKVDEELRGALLELQRRRGLPRTGMVDRPTAALLSLDFGELKARAGAGPAP